MIAKSLKLLIIFLFIVLFIFSFQKRKIIIDLQNKNKIEIIYPYYYQDILGFVFNYKCSIFYNDQQRRFKVIDLLLNAFDRPVLFCTDTSKLYCLYNFDIEERLIVFYIDKSVDNLTTDDSQRIVKYTKWSCEPIGSKEVEYIRNFIIKSEMRILKKYSMPTINLVFYKYYLPKDTLLNMLDKVKYTDSSLTPDFKKELYNDVFLKIRQKYKGQRKKD